MKWLIGVLSVLVVAFSCAAVILLTGWQILPDDTSDAALAEEVAHIEVAPEPADPEDLPWGAEAAILAQCIRDINAAPLPDMSDWNEAQIEVYTGWATTHEKVPVLLDPDTQLLDTYIRQDLDSGKMTLAHYQALIRILCN